MLSQIKKELENYRNRSVELLEGYTFSAYKVIRRISLYKNEIYPTGKFDSQGRYKYFFNIIKPRVNAEIKNIDFDTSDILLYSDSKADTGRLIMANAGMKEWLGETGQAAKLNEAIERGTEWGNVVWKKVKGDYRIMDLNNFFVLNQTAETLEDSDVIEMEIMSPLDLRKKEGIWENVTELLKERTLKEGSLEYFIYERNGEITERELNEAKGKNEGSEDKYILAKVIVGGTDKKNPKYVLFAEEITEKPYKEYHRGTYSGRWIRVGMYELLLDIQTRANEIGNQIAGGLEWASRTFFTTPDKLIAQNILTDLQSGDIIKSQGGVKQVETRMQGLDQLIADWNRLMILADLLANSFEVVTGESLPSGTPFRLGALQNINAAKLFDFIREKLSIVLQDVIEDWILPDMLRSLKAKKILELTGDSGMLTRYYELLIDSWYVSNLLSFPPHSLEIAQEIKSTKLQELQKNKSVMVELEKNIWDDFKPRVRVIITGENFNLAADLETLQTFIQLEADPIRRTALIEIAMSKKGIDAASLPKTPPQVMAPPQAPPARVPQKQPSQLDRILAASTQ